MEFELLRQKMIENGTIRVSAYLTSQGDVSQERLINEIEAYTSKYQDNIKQVFESKNPEIKLPALYEEEITKIKPLLEKYSFYEGLTFGQFSDTVSFYTDNIDELKELYYSGLLYDIKYEEGNDPHIGQSVLQSVNAPASWKRNVNDVSSPDTGIDGRGNGQLVAILDTGTDNNHVFMPNKVKLEACYETLDYFVIFWGLRCAGGTSGRNSAAPCTIALPSQCYHGTWTAGIAAGLANKKAISTNGIAPGSDIFAINIFSKVSNPAICAPKGSQNPLPAPCIKNFDQQTQDALNLLFAYTFARNKGILSSEVTQPLGAINISFGRRNYTSYCDKESPQITASVRALKKFNVPVVASAGNDALYGVAFPACIRDVIAVSGSNADTAIDKIDKYSKTQAQEGMTDLFAPGSENVIISSDPGNKFNIREGTSASSPMVAAAMAMLANIFPSFSVDQRLKVLQDTAVPFKYNINDGTLRGRQETGRRMRLCQDYIEVNSTWQCSNK
ncbi:S8 family serine peptidase [Nostoc sp. CALU 1950]|uniref:S8 family peptidase n=1 Tax=Nostoc sp. CALU 1950 TaxID=3104321 RepID=UPI003EBBC053